jgi:hypothetical protein
LLLLVCLLLLQAGAVVCGVDPNLSYFKVQHASMCLLLNPGCLLLLLVCLLLLQVGAVVCSVD